VDVDEGTMNFNIFFFLLAIVVVCGTFLALCGVDCDTHCIVFVCCLLGCFLYPKASQKLKKKATKTMIIP